MPSASRPTMVRSIWEEHGGFFSLGMTPLCVLPSSSQKRKLSLGSTLGNRSNSARTVSFYLPPKGVAPTDEYLIASDIPLSNLETVEIPLWFIPPGRELWADASANSSVNAALTWKEESVY